MQRSSRRRPYEYYSEADLVIDEAIERHMAECSVEDIERRALEVELERTNLAYLADDMPQNVRARLHQRRDDLMAQLAQLTRPMAALKH